VPLETVNGDDEAAWMFVDPNDDCAVIFYFRLKANANMPRRWLRVCGLAANRAYEVKPLGNSAWLRTNGGELQHVGLIVPDMRGDYQSTLWQIRAISTPSE
jgi:alpha-galactosidase